ncbi:CKLF-like MARVEL transmembrane domain-containing protein 3 isoform X2 [Anguilla rostrata]|uniref:CKLF-like MARVEL transmembrane domain-containing protein 3 isoform X2 n=1 Tax=Anguilla rostrata TaxID=7938 RepID=UPI0030CBCE04
MLQILYSFPQCHYFRFHSEKRALALYGDIRIQLLSTSGVCNPLYLHFAFAMGDIESPDSTPTRQAGFFALLPTKEFVTSRKGQLLIAEVVLSFITFVCFVASTAASFITAPLIEFLLAFFLLFAYSTKINERFKGFHWPLMDFLRCVSASIIYFIISIIAVSKYTDGASKAAGVSLTLMTFFSCALLAVTSTRAKVLLFNSL